MVAREKRARPFTRWPEKHRRTEPIATMHEDLYRPNTIRTAGGRHVHLLHPDPETIAIEDIAHGLAHTPRFGGHTRVFYSVAEHSMEVASALPDHLRLQGLLHDAGEAYLCDLPSPLKAALPEYRSIENSMMQVIADKFGFAWPLDTLVKHADRQALLHEWKHLVIHPSPHHWPADHLTIKRNFMEAYSRYIAQNARIQNATIGA